MEFIDLIIALFIILFVIPFGAGIYAAVFVLKRRKRMRTLGVGDAEIRKFEQELQNERARRFGNITITENWICDKSVLWTALFPLIEIDFFEKGYNIARYDTSFYVKLLFRGGGKIKLPCTFEQQEELLAALAERCPQANQREFGTFI